jgi:hypothetical protein
MVDKLNSIVNGGAAAKSLFDQSLLPQIKNCIINSKNSSFFTFPVVGAWVFINLDYAT